MDNKLYGWLVLVLALLWLLPLIGVDQLAGAVTDWVTTIVLVIIGIGLLKK